MPYLYIPGPGLSETFYSEIRWIIPRLGLGTEKAETINKFNLLIIAL